MPSTDRVRLALLAAMLIIALGAAAQPGSSDQPRVAASVTAAGACRQAFSALEVREIPALEPAEAIELLLPGRVDFVCLSREELAALRDAQSTLLVVAVAEDRYVLLPRRRGVPISRIEDLRRYPKTSLGPRTQASFEHARVALAAADLRCDAEVSCAEAVTRDNLVAMLARGSVDTFFMTEDGHSAANWLRAARPGWLGQISFSVVYRMRAELPAAGFVPGYLQMGDYLPGARKIVETAAIPTPVLTRPGYNSTQVERVAVALQAAFLRDAAWLTPEARMALLGSRYASLFGLSGLRPALAARSVIRQSYPAVPPGR